MRLGNTKNNQSKIRTKLLKRSSQFLLAGLFFGTILSGGVPLFTTHAEDTKTQVLVGAPLLTLLNIPSSLKVVSMPYLVQAKVRFLNQVQVYVDSTLADTIPLTVSDTDFTYPLSVDPGEHEVKFVGIAPSGNNPSTTIAVQYTTATGPGTSPESVPTANIPSGSPVDTPADASNGFKIPPLNDIVDNTLVALDFAKTGDRSMTISMVLRFSLLTLGLIMLVFAKWLLGVYHTIRYKWLHIRGAPLPKSLRRHPLAYIRWTGVAIILFVLLLL